MTDCKELGFKNRERKTVFQVEIDIDDERFREESIRILRGDGSSPHWMDKLANIIERG